MEHTNDYIDNDVYAKKTRRCKLVANRQTADLACHSSEVEPLTLDEARELRGSGWVGDLDTLRSGDAT